MISGSFPLTITSSYGFTNGLYAASFLGNVKVYKSNMSTIYKSTFTYTYTADTMYDYSFSLS